MSRVELWARIERADGIYTHAVYDLDTDRVYWYENEREAREHWRLGEPALPVYSTGQRTS